MRRVSFKISRRPLVPSFLIDTFLLYPFVISIILVILSAITYFVFGQVLINGDAIVATGFMISIAISFFRLFTFRSAGYRSSVLQSYATVHKLDYKKNFSKNKVRAGSQFTTMLSQGTVTQRDTIFGQGWRYFDMTYDRLSILKSIFSDDWNIHSDRNYWSVVEIQLPRKFPNMFLDSRVAHGRQARGNISGNQILKIEGNFNDFFTVYVPIQYEIDALSFLTPDVLQQMLMTSEFDIEISRDKLYLYGPYIKTEDVELMVQKAFLIYEKIKEYSSIYRDQRIKYEFGRKTTSAFAGALSNDVLFARHGSHLLLFGILFLWLASTAKEINGDVLAMIIVGIVGILIGVYSIGAYIYYRLNARRKYYDMMRDNDWKIDKLN